MVSFEQIRSFANDLASVEEGTSYGTPALKVRGKLMARLKEDHQTLVLRVSWEERERLMAIYPEVFHLTEHYRAHPWVLMHLPRASQGQAKASLLHAWQQTAPAALQRRAGAA